MRSSADTKPIMMKSQFNRDLNRSMLAVTAIGIFAGFALANGGPTGPSQPVAKAKKATVQQSDQSGSNSDASQGIEIDRHYLLGPEDVLSVTVQNVPEDSGDFLVRPDGHISFPIAGNLMVAGHTVKEVEAMLTKGLATQLRNPQVSVNIKEMRKNRIYVDGSVRSPSSYNFKKGWRISELIAVAGGLTDEPQRLTAVLYDPGHPTQVVPLRKIFLDVDDRSDLPVQPGDSLYVRPQPTMEINVVGQVARSGVVKIYEGQGAVQALGAAQGGTPQAALSKAEIIRGGHVIPVDLYDAVINGDASKNVVMKANDTLVVPQEYEQVSVVGTVARAGPVLIPDGRPLTLSSAIGDAGGLATRAKQAAVLTTVGKDGKLVSKSYNLKTLGTKGHPDPVLKNNDVVFVPQSGAPSFNDFLGISQLYYTVRGIMRGY